MTPVVAGFPTRRLTLRFGAEQITLLVVKRLEDYVASAHSAIANADDDAKKKELAYKTQEDIERGIVDVNNAYLEAVTKYKRIESVFARE